eukprot:scaffold1807_cov140-Cylindrotheca_fusiformis.AAC.6
MEVARVKRTVFYIQGTQFRELAEPPAGFRHRLVGCLKLVVGLAATLTGFFLRQAPLSIRLTKGLSASHSFRVLDIPKQRYFVHVCALERTASSARQ